MTVAGVLFGLVDERPLERRHRAIEPVDRVAHPELEVGRDLVVARARGVEPPCCFADRLVEPRLDVEMNVLVLGAEGKGAGFDFGADFL